jgi:two-component system C4-dicarboxylate transport sensor histidine kinase DctB
LGEIVSRLTGLMDQRLKALQIKTEIRLASPMNLVCDPEQIYQVLLNLILNAIEAMEKVTGERRLTIAASARNGMVLIRISDTGAGIPPEKHEQLFDPFFTSRASGGGLGLSILQTIVLRHGGSVSLESEVGHGATFTVTLPHEGPAETGDAA